MKNYTVKVITSKGNSRLSTKSIRRFLTYIRTINWDRNLKKVYLKVYYGKQKDVFGKLSQFHNEGWYTKENEFWQAFTAFNEVS